MLVRKIYKHNICLIACLIYLGALCLHVDML